MNKLQDVEAPLQPNISQSAANCLYLFVIRAIRGLLYLAQCTRDLANLKTNIA